MQQLREDLVPLGDNAEGLTFTEDLRQLAGEAKTLAQAELAFQKSRASYASAETKFISGLLIAATVAALFSAMAFVIGTVIALGPILGHWGAMAAVVIALLVVAGFCAYSARSRMKRMMAIVSDDRSK